MADRSLSNITLQDAYSRAQAALEGGDSPRAVAITQHVLRYYPQYIDAYRLLGEAYLDLGRPEEAMRFFTHVLNADPQNVLAHIGRAIIAEDHHQVDIAIDEYERAFEVDPSITELRGELLRLYAIRYGSAGAAIRTTPSGLAYVHLRAGLRDAAISELGYVAQVRPDRWDVEVALAEALWRNEQLDECAAVAGDILAGHPACVKCKWLLGYLHWSSGRTESGRQYLMDAVALDPAYRIANAIWDATPWPVDRRITRAQTAMVPGWTQEELAGSDLDISVALPPEPPASTAPSGSRRVTQKFDTRPPLPGESRRVTQKFDTRPPLPGQTTELTPPAEEAPPVAAAAAEAVEWDSILGSADVPAPFDLDWLDDWAAAAETAPAAPAPTAHATLEFEAIAPPATEEGTPDMLGVTPAPEAALSEAVGEAAAPGAVLTEGAAEVAEPEAAAVEAAAESAEPEASLTEVAAEATAPEAAPVAVDGIAEQEATEITMIPVAPAEPALSADVVADATVDEAGVPAAEPDGFLAWLSEPATDAPQAEEIVAPEPAEDLAEASDAADSPAAQAGMFPAWLDEQPAVAGAPPPAEDEDAAVPVAEASSAQPSMFPEWMDTPANAVEEAAPPEGAAGEATANIVEEAAPAETAADATATEPADLAEAGAPAPARHQVVHLFPAWLEEATSDDEDESDLEMLPAWMREAGPLEAGTPAAAAETTADAQVAAPDAAALPAHAEEAAPAAPVPADALSLLTAEQAAPPSIAGEESVASVTEDQEAAPVISLDEPAPFAAAAQGDGADVTAGTPTETAAAPDAASATIDQSPLIGEPALPVMESVLAEAATDAESETTVAEAGTASEPAAVAASELDAPILPDDLFPAWLEEIERSEAAGATEAQVGLVSAPEATAEEAAPVIDASPEASTEEAEPVTIAPLETTVEEAAPVMAATVWEAQPAEEPQAAVPEAMSAEDVPASAAGPEAIPAEDVPANEAAPEAPPTEDIQAGAVAPEDVLAQVALANDVAPEDVPAQVAPEAVPTAEAEAMSEPATPPALAAAVSEPDPTAIADADHATVPAAEAPATEDEMFPAWMSETGAASLPVVVAPDVPEAESAESTDREPASAAPVAPVESVAEAEIAAAPADMAQPEIDASAAAETASAQAVAPETPAAEANVLPNWLTEAVNVQAPEATGAPTPLALDEETLFAADHTFGGQAGEIPMGDDLFPAWLEAGPAGAPDGGELLPSAAAQAAPETPVQEGAEVPLLITAEDAAFPAGQDAAASAPATGFAEASGTPDTMDAVEAEAPGPTAGRAESIPAPPDTGQEADEFPAWMGGSWFEVAVAPAPGETSAEPLVIVPESALESSSAEPVPPVEAGASLPAPAGPGAALLDAPAQESPAATPEATQVAAPEAAGDASVAETAAAENELVGAPGFIVADDAAPVVSYPAEATPEAAEPLHEEILDWPAPPEGSTPAATAEADHPTKPGTAPEETAALPARTADDEPHDMPTSESAPNAAAAADTENAEPMASHEAGVEDLALPVLGGPEPGVGAPSTPADAAAETAALAQDASAATAESGSAPVPPPALDHFAKVGYNHGDDSQVPDDTAEPGPPLTSDGAAGADAGPGKRPAAVEADHLPDGAAEHGAPAASQAAFATSEEDNMAPSYKEDDDQERQFDFDWDRDALPDYLKPFLMNETPGQPGQPPAPAGPAANAAPPAGGRPMPPAPEAGGPGNNDFNLDLGNIQPFDFGAAPPSPPPGPAAPIRPLPATPPPAAPAPQQAPGGFNESDFGGVQPFNFGAPAGPGGGDEFDFGSDALPSWLGSGGNTGPAFSFDTSAGPQATDQTPGPDLSSPGIPDWLRTPETAPPPARPGPAAPPAAPDGDFDFGSEALPSWLSASAAPAPKGAPQGAPQEAPPAANDFGDVQPFDFGAPANQGQPFDFGAMAGGGAPQPFNFSAPATPERGPGPAAGPSQEFDLGGVQPFNFGAPPTPPAAQTTPGGPAPGGDFDFGGIQPFDFGGTTAQAGEASAPQAAGAPGEFDFSMVESFDFRGPGGAPSAGGGNDFDFGGVQPFDFGGTSQAAPAGPAPAGDFDFGGVQPFDFGGAPAGGESAGDVSDVDDFIDFLSVGAGNAAPAVPAPDEFAFDLGGDVQPFSLEGMGLGSTPAAPGPAFGAPPAPGPAFGAPPAPMAGASQGGVRLPAGPGPEEMGSLAGDEFSFEPFMFDAEGGAAPPAAPAPPAFNQAPTMPASPFNPGSAFAGRAPADVPPGLEDLPDLQPFSFEGLDTSSDQGYGFDTGAMGQSFGRRATDRGETSRSGMAFNLEEESSGPAGDVHSFSWQRRSTPAREPAHAPEAPETSGSIFAKARKRKEELEQTLRQEAEARGEVYTPPPVEANLHPEEAAELSYWPNLDEEEEVASAPAQPAVQPFDFNSVAGPTPADVAQDMASLQLAPFEFEEEGPPAAGSPTIQLPEESAQANAQAPAAPEFVADQTIEVPLQDQAGAPAMPEPFAFEAAEIPAEIQPFAFDLGAEAPAAPAEAQAAPPPAEPFAFEAPETGAAEVEPFAFEAPASGPTAVQPFTFDPQEGPPPAVEPFTFEAQESAAATAEPFAFEPEAGEATPVQPFTFETQETEAAAVQPFSFETQETEATPVQPFSFETQETEAAAVQPFTFEAEQGQPTAVEPFTFETQETEAAAVEPFTFEAPEAGASVEPFVFDTAAPVEPVAQAAPGTAEVPEAAAPAVEPFAFDMTEAPEAPAVEPFTFDMAESVAPPSFAPAEPSAVAPPAEAAPQETAAGELLWSIPVAEAGSAPAAAAPPSGGFGEEVAPGEFDFSGLQPFDLGALDLTPEERAYLTGESAPAGVSAQAPAEPAAMAPAPEEPAGIPELQLQQTEPAGPVEPFSFDMTEFEPPAAEPPAMDLGGVPPAEAPGYEAGAPTATVEPVEFGMSAAGEAAAVEPFQFDTEAAAVEPFQFDTEAPAPAPAEPFQFEPFQFEPEAPPAPEPVQFEAEAAEAEATEPFSFEAPAEPAVTHYETTTRTGTGPLAAETWAEIPAAGAFDFSGVEMDQAPAEPAVAEAPEPAVAEAPEPVVAQAPAAPAAEAPAEAPAPVPPAPVAEAPAPQEAPVAAQPAPVPVAPPAPAGGSIDELARHLRENPDDTAGRLALAIGYEQRDDISRAAEQYRLLIKGRNVPENLLDIVTGNLRDLVEAQPDNPSLHRLLGDAYMKQGQYQMAIAQYNWLLTKGTR